MKYFTKKIEVKGRIPKKEGNYMAGERPICLNLKKFYGLSPQKKKKYLCTKDAKCLFDGLPREVSKILMKGFLSGEKGKNLKNWSVVSSYFQKNSRIIPALIKNPGTFTMLEKMYHFETVKGVIDNYFLQSIAGGQALKNRYDVVNQKTAEDLNDLYKKNKKILMIDIGSGPGRNCVDLCKINPHFVKKIQMECIDIDSEAISFGKKLVKQNKFKNIVFVKKSMTKLKEKYPANVDYGLLIGVLCSLTFIEKVRLLKTIRSYFKSGAKLVAAALTSEMVKKDLLCSYILRETCGWGLQYPRFGELKKAFEKAGWKFGGVYQDKPTRLYEIVIGIA